jgi:hypothetical protein
MFEPSTPRKSRSACSESPETTAPRGRDVPGYVHAHSEYGADQTVYLIVDRLARLWSVYRETEVERIDLEMVITDLMSGQFNDPVRVIAFNTLEHWSEDISKQIADELQVRCDIEGVAVPEHVRNFVASHTGPSRQLSLRLA